MTLGLLKNWLMQGAMPTLPLLLLALISAVSPVPVWAQATGNQAGLVVVYGDGRVTTLCVAFSEPEISGADLVSRSGLSLVSSAGPLGLTICSLDGEGCPSTDCFCECHSTPCVYWNYYHGNPDGSWTYANTGAAFRKITNGDVDAWLWGESSKLPASVTFDDICDQASLGQAEPVALSPPDQETPVPTGTPVLTETAPPTQTPPGAVVIATSTSSPTPEATASAVVKTATSATATPTASPAPHAQASSGDESAVNEEPGLPSAEPTQSDETAPPDDLIQARKGQIVSFVAVLSIVGGVYALLSRRSALRG